MQPAGGWWSATATPAKPIANETVQSDRATLLARMTCEWCCMTGVLIGRSVWRSSVSVLAVNRLSHDSQVQGARATDSCSGYAAFGRLGTRAIHQLNQFTKMFPNALMAPITIIMLHVNWPIGGRIRSILARLRVIAGRLHSIGDTLRVTGDILPLGPKRSQIRIS
jgi:hypothetical protein